MPVVEIDRERPDYQQTEDECVLMWRLEQLASSGFSGVTLLALALRFDVDIHAADALVRRGCPTQTALRILL